MNSHHRSYRMLILCATLFLFWAAALTGTDSYYNNYTLCVAAAVFCLSFFFFTGKGKNIKRSAYLPVFSVLLSLMALLANYHLFEPLSEHYLKAILTFIGGLLLFGTILSALSMVPDGGLLSADAKGSAPGKVFLISFLVIASIDLIFLFGAFYPGFLTLDSSLQVGQIFSHEYSNHNPYWHTFMIRICLTLGFRLFHSANAGVAIYSVCQILLLGSCFSFSLSTLEHIRVRRGLIWTFLVLFAVVPYNIAYSVTMWKDIPFSIAVLFFVTALYRILLRLGHMPFNYIILFCSTAGFCLLRSNGFAACCVSFLIGLLLIRKAAPKALLIICVGLVCSFILKHPVLNMLHVTQPDTAEMLSIPEQQIARVISEGCELSEEQKAFLGRITDLDAVPGQYVPWLSNPIKTGIREFGGVPYLSQHLREFLSVWFEIGLRHPVLYGKAWIDQTKGYWNSGYPYWIYALELCENNFGISLKTHAPAVKDQFESWFETFEETVFYQPLISVGLMVWILFACLFVCLCRKKTALITLLAPFICIIGTLVLTTPVAYEFRYAYALALSLPFLIGVTFASFGEQTN